MAFGAFPAVLLVGAAVLAELGVLGRVAARASWLGALALACTVGLLLLTPALLVAAMLGIYDPVGVGLVGWVLSLVCVIAFGIRRPGHFRLQVPRIHLADAVLSIGLAAAAIVYVGWPADTSIVGRDMSVYSNHAIHIATTGELRLDYPWPSQYDPIFRDAFAKPSGFYHVGGGLSAQFGHAYPVWLAQIFGTFGVTGLYRANALFMLLGVAAVHGVMSLFVGRALAAAGTLFLAFNAATIWMAHITLSEPLAQATTWSALLVWLAGRRASASVLAGALIGYAFAVRIDALLLVPIVVTAHASHRLLGARIGGWRYLYTGMAVSVVVAAAYYFVESRPYIEAHAAPLLQIVMAGAASLLLLAVTTIDPVRSKVGKWISTPRFAAASVGIVVIAVAYAAFARPYIEPFDMDILPGSSVLRRTHIEDALPNLGRYLSEPVIFLGVMGAAITIWRALTTSQSRHALVVFIVIGGYAALYLWNQSIFPDHFWAIRRFVPVVLPGVVLLSLVALRAVSVPTAIRVPAALVLGAFAVGHTLNVGLPTAFIAQDRGSYAQVARAADIISKQDSPAIGLELGQDVLRPLLAAFHVDLVPVDIDKSRGKRAAREWIALRAEAGREATVVVKELRLVRTLRARLIEEVTVRGTRVASTYKPVPRDTFVFEDPIYIFAVGGLDHVGTPLGGEPAWTVPEFGFSVQEELNGVPARWTNETAGLRVPLEAGGAVDAIHLVLADAAPGGTQLRVLLNGEAVFEGRVGPGRWQGTFPVDVPLGAESVSVLLMSDTFVPEQAFAGSDDDRRLGVMVESITLIGDDDD